MAAAGDVIIYHLIHLFMHFSPFVSSSARTERRRLYIVDMSIAFLCSEMFFLNNLFEQTKNRLRRNEMQFHVNLLFWCKSNLIRKNLIRLI